MKSLRMLSVLVIALMATMACTGIQPPNQAQPAPQGYIKIPTKEELLANAQLGVEQPEIIYARLLLSREVIHGGNNALAKPDDPVWVIAVKSGNASVQFPGFGEVNVAGVIRIINAATGEEISISSIQDIQNDEQLQRLKTLPDRDGTITIEPQPLPTPFTPQPTPTAIHIAPSALSTNQQDSFTSPLSAPDILEATMRNHAGANPINCGVVPIDGASEAANQCVDSAYQAKKAFTVVYNLQGMDSVVARGLAGNAQGEIRSYYYDSDPSGGSNVGARILAHECRTIQPTFHGPSELRGCE